MKHLAFYYAIGFAAVGCLMLYVGLSTFIGPVLNNYNPYALAVLATAMPLPFVIAVLSWRDWTEIQRKNNTHPET
jgi:hypothetical protein